MSISFGNLTTNNSQINPELQKRIESQENFTAIDTEKLKQDTVEIASKAGEQVKDNFVFRILKNLGVEDPKKFLKSVGLTALTVAGFALLGNKTSKHTAQLGIAVDEFLQKGKGKWIGEIGEKISSFTKNYITGPIKKIPLFKSISSDLANGSKIKAKNPMARAQCSGIVYQFSCAVIESMQGIFYGRQKDIAKNFTKKDASELLTFIKNGKTHNVDFKKAFEFVKAISTSGKTKDDLIELAKKPANELTQMVADGTISKSLLECLQGMDFNTPAAGKFIDEVLDRAMEDKKILEKLIGNIDLEDTFKTIILDDANDRVEFASNLTKNIRAAQGFGDKDNKKLLDFFKQIQEGKKGDEFSDILMCHGMDSWGLTNWIDKLGHKIRGNNWKNVSRANLGSALIKFNTVNGDLATTAAGKFVQAAPTIVTESISNYVCDAAAINAIVIPSFISLFNSVQEAPKEQKAATLASSFASDIGSLTVVIPTAVAITYGIANLSKIKDNGILKTPLRWIGNLFAMGLQPNSKALSKVTGGAFRFAMIMFVFSGMISKPIEKLVQKIFGKPYNKEEAQKAAQLEEQKKQIIPELGITQGELMEKMQKNPAAMQRLQSDAKLAYTIEQNPKLILDLLDGKEVQYIEPPKSPASQGIILSPANQNRLNNKTNMSPAAQVQPNPKTNSTPTTSNTADSATYIPSSAFIAPKSTMSVQQQSEYDAMMTKADKYLKAAEKYI